MIRAGTTWTVYVFSRTSQSGLPSVKSTQHVFCARSQWVKVLPLCKIHVFLTKQGQRNIHRKSKNKYYLFSGWNINKTKCTFCISFKENIDLVEYEVMINIIHYLWCIYVFYKSIYICNKWTKTYAALQVWFLKTFNVFGFLKLS